MYAKIHKSYRTVVAICDSDILGKKFEEGKFQLDIRENFYKDKEISHEELINLIQFQAREDSTFNIVGEKSIQAAIDAGIIRKENVRRVANIPFILVF